MKIDGAIPKFAIGNYAYHDKYGYEIQGRIVMFHHIVIADVVVGYVYSFRTNGKESLIQRDTLIEEKYINLDPNFMNDWGKQDVGYLPTVVDILSNI